MATTTPNLRIAISYAYVERDNTRRNLAFFLAHGLDSSVALLSIIVKGGRPSDGAGSGGKGGFSVSIPEEHRERVRVTFAPENVGYDMESHRRNAALFAEVEKEKEPFTHYVAMNDSTLGPFCTSSTSGAVENEEENEEEGPGPGPWHRLFAQRLTRLRSHPPTAFVATIRHFSYFLFFSVNGWRTFAEELTRRELRSYRDAADVECWLGTQPHDSIYPEALHWDCPHTPWDVVGTSSTSSTSSMSSTSSTSPSPPPPTTVMFLSCLPPCLHSRLLVQYANFTPVSWFTHLIHSRLLVRAPLVNHQCLTAHTTCTCYTRDIAPLMSSKYTHA